MKQSSVSLLRIYVTGLWSHCPCSDDSQRLCCLPAATTVNNTYRLRRDPVFWFVLICGAAKFFGSTVLQPACSVCVSLSAFFNFARFPSGCLSSSIFFCVSCWLFPLGILDAGTSDLLERLVSEMCWRDNNTTNNNNRINIEPYGHNFRGTGGRSDQCSMKAWLNKKETVLLSLLSKLYGRPPQCPAPSKWWRC